MATKKRDSKTNQPDDSGLLKSTAEAIGSAIGTIAVKTGLSSEPASTPPQQATKPGKLQKKNKKRLPRKEKKALAKAKKAA